MSSAIITGIQEGPEKWVVYGTEGIGKSTFASMFPKPLFIDSEGSTKNLDVARFEYSNSWANIMHNAEDAKKSGYKTLVIDSADWAEKYFIDYICETNGKKGLEDFGYGKGYTYLAEEFGRFLELLNEVKAEGMNIVITAHAKMRKVEQPDEMGAYDKWEMKLTKLVAPMVKEWADNVLFINYKTFVVKDENGSNKAQGGKRVMYTQHHPCWDAKNRHNLPPECEFDYKVIKDIVEGSGKPQEATKKPTTKAKAETPKEAPQKASENVYDKLREWIARDGIKEDQVISAIASKGGCQYDSKLEDLDEKFVRENILAKWSGFLKYAKKFASFTDIEVKEDDMPFK